MAIPPSRASAMRSRQPRFRSDGRADRERLLGRTTRFLLNTDYTQVQVTHPKRVEGELHDLFDQPALLVEGSCRHLGIVAPPGVLLLEGAVVDHLRAGLACHRCTPSQRSAALASRLYRRTDGGLSVHDWIGHTFP